MCNTCLHINSQTIFNNYTISGKYYKSIDVGNIKKKSQTMRRKLTTLDVIISTELYYTIGTQTILNKCDAVIGWKLLKSVDKQRLQS